LSADTSKSFVDLMEVPGKGYFCALWCGDTVDERGDVCQKCRNEEKLVWDSMTEYQRQGIRDNQKEFFGEGNEPYRRLDVR
jgi:hypothetical protein